MKTSNPLRCFCARQPLLAMYGVDKGKIYIHVKIHKQRRIYGEVLITEGTIRIHCRECLRWHTVKITQPNRACLEEIDKPEFIYND